MFNIEPYYAKRHTVVMDGQRTLEQWEPCRVLGIDASRDEPQYIVEVRSKSGEFYIDRADVIRKDAP